MRKSKKIKLLYVLSEFVYGSKIRQLIDLVTELDKDLFDIEVCAVDIGDEATNDVKSLNIPIFELKIHPPRKLQIDNIVKFVKSPRIAREKKYDLVHSLCYQSLFIEPFILKSFTNAKYIYTKSNLQWDNHKLNWLLKSAIADKIISISSEMDLLLKEKGFSHKSEKIYLGINTNYFKERVDDRIEFRRKLNIELNSFVFGCAAQFVEFKKHLDLIAAFENLCKRYNNLYLLLCGPNHNDDYYHKVMRKCKNSECSDRIIMAGTIADMPRFYSAIDCFVLPSFNEPFGYVYIEAMSSSKPVIACKVGGPIDIVTDNATGFLVNPSSPVELVSAMEKYIINKSLASVHGKYARERVIQYFSTNVMVEKHEKLYRKLLEGQI